MPPPDRRRRRPRSGGPSPEILAQWTPEERARYENERRLETPIAEMKLSVRCVNTLESLSVILCKDLMGKTAEELFEIPNFGETTLKEIIRAVQALGLTPPWKMPKKPPAKKKPAAAQKKRKRKR